MRTCGPRAGPVAGGRPGASNGDSISSPNARVRRTELRVGSGCAVSITHDQPALVERAAEREHVLLDALSRLLELGGERIDGGPDRRALLKHGDHPRGGAVEPVVHPAVEVE